MIDMQQWDPLTVKRVEDIVGNQEIWQPLANDIQKNVCPHIVLCGPSGCGKTLFSKLILEKRNVPVLRIECTANAGLRDLRDAIRGFARGSRTASGDYRWIVLEHADSLAGDTQAFLRRMMETTSNSTRFLFECVDAGAISEPILSRSSLFVVNAPNNVEIKSEIQRRTEYTLSEKLVDAFVSISKSNMRNAIYYALAARWNPDWDSMKDYNLYMKILAAAPKNRKTVTTVTTTKDKNSDNHIDSDKISSEWLQWAIYAEKECRYNGIDCRDLLFFGWPTNPDISYMRNQWSRLGGISTHALFFRAVRKLI